MRDDAGLPSKDWARGLRMLGYILGVIGALLLVVPILGLVGSPDTFAADAVTEDDFTNRDRQAMLMGMVHGAATSIYLLPIGNATLEGRLGRSGVFFTPITNSDTSPDGDVAVFIASPTVTGLTRETVNPAVRTYLDELADQPDPDAMLVTLLPQGDHDIFRSLGTQLPGVTATTLFVWPDHVVATEFGGPSDPPGFWQAGLTLLASALAFGAAAVLRRRQGS
ncbi:hypothetical protein [Jannaschia pohangensis]|uniref:Uncharacterized protein n=1 Tax=Jannaschia pohangensis TaxID=390807 RepID=A0A1I3IZX9_9RHOB|nr:hypothetical protein [Jannaschia pohangensis]SFI53582.1 hypothetical protein SAMN04488095_1161 [Jannaschia pohangensis]